MLRKVPLIVVLGSTGTGKTKLSIELAERFGSEIISADSMQVYTNLNIATAKATKEEQARVKHHLLDVTTPDQPFTVLNFRDATLPIIENLLSKSKCPIVVGGTNYYIESLLWDILVRTKAAENPDNKTDITNEVEIVGEEEPTAAGSENAKNPPFIDPTEMADMESDVLHQHLKQIDPDSANRIHPNNKRKIVRAIEVYQESGKTLTDQLRAQREKPGGNRLGGPLRYPHTILFWLRCKQDILDERLNKRVDAMLEQGLLHEIRAFHNVHKIDKSKTDNSLTYTRGVLQTIGFKEFIPYLEQFDEANDHKIEDYLRLNGYRMPTEEHFKAQKPSSKNVTQAQKLEEQELQQEATQHAETLPSGLDVLNSCLNELKLVTRRYSKKQSKWINNRFLASKDRQVPDLYELDTSDVKQWQAKVFERAVALIDSYRKGVACEIQPMGKREHPSAGLNEEITNFCEVCQRTFVGEFQWILHMKSNKHKRKKYQICKTKEKLNDVQTDTGEIK